MTKQELINDMNFRRKCCEYGLDWMNFEIYGDVILLNTSNKYVYVLLDKNYNTIGIHKVEFANMHLTKQQITDGYNEIYNLIDESEGYCFPYPFQNLSLKQIVNLSNRINIYGSNHGHSSDFTINGDMIIGENDKTYICLLSYIKFMGIQIEEYFLNSYKMKILGFDYPDIHSYIKNTMYNIRQCVNDNIKIGRRPFPVDVLEYIGQNNKDIELYNHYLYNIIDLLMKEKGYKIKGGFKHYREIEPTEKNTEDLSVLSTNLLKILEVSDEEVKQKIDNIHATFEIECIDLNSWIEDKSKIKTKSK